MELVAVDVLEAQHDDAWDEASVYAKAFISSYSSNETRKAYTHDLKNWFSWCASNNIHPYINIRRTHVELYMRGLEEKGLANATRGRRLAAVSSWFNWLVDERVKEYNPASRVSRPKKRKNSLPGLTRPEAADLLNQAEKWDGSTDAAIKLMMLNGLRVGGVLGADIGDIATRNYTPFLTVIEKGDKELETPLAPRTMAAVDRAIDGRDVGPLLINMAERRMTYSNVRYRLTKLCQEAGIKEISPHGLRRTFIRLADDEGVPLAAIQRAVGHEDPKTTIGYLDDNDSPYEHPSFNVMAATAR